MRLSILEEKELATLMGRAQQGDKNAYRIVLERSRHFLTGFIGAKIRRYGMQADLQEDIVQDVLLAMHNKLQTYSPDRPFLPWLMAIARFKTIDFLRKTDKKLMHLSQQEFDQFEAIESATELPYAIEDLGPLLEVLNDKQKTLLTLTKLHGVSVKEAADRLQLSQSDVKTSVHRALSTLKKEYKKRALK